MTYDVMGLRSQSTSITPCQLLNIDYIKSRAMIILMIVAKISVSFVFEGSCSDNDDLTVWDHTHVGKH